MPPHRFSLCSVVYFHQLSHDNEAARASGRTGGKGQHFIAACHRDVRFHNGTLCHSGKPGRIRAVILPAKTPGRGIAAGFGRLCHKRCENLTEITALRGHKVLRWSSFFVTLTRKSFDIIMPAFFFQMVSYIHLMNVGGYDCNTHIHNP